MKPMTEPAAEAAIRVACRELHLPTIAAEAAASPTTPPRNASPTGLSSPRSWPPKSKNAPTAAAPGGCWKHAFPA